MSWSEVPANASRSITASAVAAGSGVCDTKNSRSYLVTRGAQRPASTKTLSTSIGALFQPKLDDAEVQTLLAELQRNGVFVVNGSKVVYSLPD